MLSSSKFSVLLFLIVVLSNAPVQAEPAPVGIKFKSMFGELGDEPGLFLGPSGIDELSDGRIVVFDSTRIQICDLEGNCKAFGARGTEPGEFALDGRGLAVDGQDRIVVSDTNNWRIQVCDEFGQCTTFGRNGEDTPNFDDVGSFFYPSSVDVDRKGQVWVGSRAYHRVQVCDFGGQCKVFGEPIQICDDHECQESSLYFGSSFSPESFNIHVGSNDQVFLSRSHYDKQLDYVVNNILVCDQSEVPTCKQLGQSRGGDGVGEFSYPGPMDSDDDGILYVVDWGNHRIQNCNAATGECRASGSRGDGPGQFLQLADISVRDDGLLSTVEFENRRVQLFSIDHSSGFSINAGLNDAWFNPETDGQGFFIDVYQDLGLVFLGWFTYETDDRDESTPDAIVGERFHRWLTAQGPYEGNLASLDVTMTSSGVFESPDEVVNTETGAYGTISIEFHDCANGTLKYDLHAANRSGELPITRIVPDNARVCEIMDFE
jgi:hypothetical protein